MKQRYYSMAVEGQVADIEIYGDITSWPFPDSGEMSAHTLSRRLAELDEGVGVINVNINSYGGEVAEGLAIYNALRRHPARVVTRVDGFACSIASAIFMAGDERVMHDASLLMIHNAWTFASGNADDLRKQADDLDTITESVKRAYLSRANVGEDEIAQLMDAETWIKPEDALEMGLATSVEAFEPANPTASARRSLMAKLSGKARMAEEPEETEETSEADEPDAPGGSQDAVEGQDEPKGEDEQAPEPEEGEAEEGEAEEPKASTLGAFLAAAFKTKN